MFKVLNLLVGVGSTELQRFIKTRGSPKIVTVTRRDQPVAICLHATLLSSQ